MQSTNTCPLCGREIEFPDRSSGKPVVCDHCRTLVFKNRYFTLDSILKLRTRFFCFTVLFLIEVTCLCVGIFAGSLATDFRTDVTFVAILIFIPLLIVYISFLRALFAPVPLFVLCIFFSLFVAVVFYGKEVVSPVFLLSVISLDVFFRLWALIKAVTILRYAEISLDGDNRCSRMMKGCSFLLSPLLLFLLLSIVFLGSMREETGLCRDCGAWYKNDSICLLGIRLLPFPEYQPTAFSNFLDPENLCLHHAGKVIGSKEEYYLMKPIGISNFINKMRPFSMGHMMTVWTWYGSFMTKKENLNTYSLKDYLSAKDSQSLARRIISGDLSHDEVRDFYLSLNPDADVPGEIQEVRIK